MQTQSLALMTLPGNAAVTENGAQQDGGWSAPRRRFALSRIFFSRHDELRAGWRMLLFLLLALAVAMLLVGPVAMVFPDVDPVFLSLTLVIALLAASWIMTRFVNRKPLGAIGVGFHPAAGKEFGIGCLLGILMMAGVFLVQYGLGYLRWSSLGLSAGEVSTRVMISALFFMLAAAGEELMFRGYLFQTLMQAVTFLPAAMMMSLLFGMRPISRIPHVTVFAAVNVALAGLWLSFAYFKTRSLWLPVGLHASWNFCQTTLFSFPTSGRGISGDAGFS